MNVLVDVVAHIPVIQTLGALKYGGSEFEVSLGYITRLSMKQNMRM